MILRLAALLLAPGAAPLGHESKGRSAREAGRRAGRQAGRQAAEHLLACDGAAQAKPCREALAQARAGAQKPPLQGAS